MNDSGTTPGPLRPPRLGGSVGAPRRRIVPIGLGLLLYALAFVYFLPGINQKINTYDEGVIVYGATRVLQGQVPYRDFWTMYSPGQFYILAAAFKLFGAYVYRPPEGGGNGTPTIGWDDAWMHEVCERPIDGIEPTSQSVTQDVNGPVPRMS